MTSATGFATSGTSLTPTAAAIAFCGGLASLAILAALHVARADLAPGGHVISEYAIGYAPLGLAFFVAQSLGCLALTLALLSGASTVGVRIGIGLLVLAAIGLGMAVAFPMDPLTTPAGQENLGGTMHGVAALVGIPSFIAALLVLSYALRRRTLWVTSGGWLVGLGHLTWIALLLMIVCMVLLITQQMTSMAGLVGWANRLLVVAYGLWLDDRGVAIAVGPHLNGGASEQFNQSSGRGRRTRATEPSHRSP